MYTYDFWEVLGFAVALSHSSVPVPEHGRDGATNDIAPAKNNSTQTFDRDSGGLEQTDDAGRSAWRKQGVGSA